MEGIDGLGANGVNEMNDDETLTNEFFKFYAESEMMDEVLEQVGEDD